MQSDQHLCFSLIRKYHIKTCYRQNFSCLASHCSLAGCEAVSSLLGRKPKDRFSHLKVRMVSATSSLDRNLLKDW